MINVNKKGFTLIELLIVIAIIGLLAVALAPALFGAPAKGRDASRIADLERVRSAILAAGLNGTAIPDASFCFDGTDKLDNFLTQLDGKIPQDPVGGEDYKLNVSGTECKSYMYIKGPKDGTNQYSFGLYARMETADAGNKNCPNHKIEPASAGIIDDAMDDTKSCYILLTQ